MSIFARIFRWDQGRKKSGYDKMFLCEVIWPVKFDVYLLRFSEGCRILPHTATVESGKYYRLDIILKKSDKGGKFLCDNPIYQSNRIKVFRPDISEHQVSKVVKGTRYLLSVGWVRNS